MEKAPLAFVSVLPMLKFIGQRVQGDPHDHGRGQGCVGKKTEKKMIREEVYVVEVDMIVAEMAETEELLRGWSRR